MHQHDRHSELVCPSLRKWAISDISLFVPLTVKESGIQNESGNVTNGIGKVKRGFGM